MLDLIRMVESLAAGDGTNIPATLFGIESAEFDWIQESPPWEIFQIESPNKFITGGGRSCCVRTGSSSTFVVLLLLLLLLLLFSFFFSSERKVARNEVVENRRRPIQIWNVDSA